MPATKSFRWSALLLGLGCLALLGATVRMGVGRLHGERGPAREDLARFTDQDVAVEVSYERDARGRIQLAARFTPTRRGFRLYAMELPKQGVKGIGRPTLLEISRAPTLRATGPLSADQSAGEVRSDVLGLTLPAYPPGPVTLRLPVAVETSHGATATLSVTYMACSERKCMPPVEDRHVTVRVPGTP